MTAPGDSVLIFILLALFVASAAYAAGRLHQRHQFRQDREEAYRDGYETASDRVFSLAVRAVTPRRTPRGTAAVHTSPAKPAGPPTPRSPLPAPATPPLTAGTTLPPSSAGTTLPPSTARHHFAHAAGQDAVLGVAQPAAAAGSTATCSRPARGADPGRAVRHQGVAVTRNSAPLPAAVADVAQTPTAGNAGAAGMTPEHPPTAVRSSLSMNPMLRDKPLVRRRPDQRRSWEPARSKPTCGFPVPLPLPGNTVAEPAAVGGVTYQPFPDPRPADGSGPVLGRRPPEAIPSGTPAPSNQTPPAGNQRARFGSAFPSIPPAPAPEHLPAVGDGHLALPPSRTASTQFGPSESLSPSTSKPVRPQEHNTGSAGPPDSAADVISLARTPTSDHAGAAPDASCPSDGSAVEPEESSSGGKHTVPDELVKAATYRLPADRIFRARVPGSTPLPEEPTTPLSVPKPRRHSNENVAPPP